MTNKADIYSFGVVIWEICTLERPAWRGNLRDIKYVLPQYCISVMALPAFRAS